MTITVISDEWQQFVLSFTTNQTKHTHNNNKTGTQNQHFTCQLNMCSVCPPFCRTTQSRRWRHSPTLLTMNDCGSFCRASTILLLVSVRQLRRNFDDGRPSAEGHPRWHNQPGSNPGYSMAIWLNELHFLAASNAPCFWPCEKARRPAAASTCNGHISLGCRAASLGQRTLSQ